MGKKTFKIEARVKRPKHSMWGTEEMIADMLRYDIMHIIKKNISDPDCVIYTLEGKVRYTKARWDSFGIETKEV
jgi:hypothetical protein